MLPGAGPGRRNELEELATQLLACVQEPFAVDGVAEVGASIGISHYPIDGEDAHSLLRRARRRHVRRRGGQSGCGSAPRSRTITQCGGSASLSDFRRALQSEEIVVRSNRSWTWRAGGFRGAEELVRGSRGAGPAGRRRSVVQTVEQTGLIGPLTR